MQSKGTLGTSILKKAIDRYYKELQEYKGRADYELATRTAFLNLLSIWELKITLAKHERDTQQAIDMALQARQQLLDTTYTMTSAETEEYFQRVQIPRAKLDQ